MAILTSNFLTKAPYELMNFSPLPVTDKCQAKITASSYLTKWQPLIKKIIIQNKKVVTLNSSQQTCTQTRRKTRSLLATIFGFLDEFICNHIDSPLHPSVDPNHILSPFSLPVKELPPTACHVAEGNLPSCLEGAYIRNGPNPQFTPQGPYHLFDGDGMLHMIKISQGKATFTSRYVKTYKYLVDCENGYSIFPSIFSSFSNGLASSIARCILSVAKVATGLFDPVKHGFGTANTSLVLFNGRLFALCECDLPYEVKITSDGDIVTLGRHNFLSNKPFFRMTAHPKIDEDTREAFAYSFNITRPFLTFFRIDSKGKKQKDIPISTEKLTFIHDFSVTKNFSIFPDAQIVVDLMEVLRGRLPFKVHHNKVPRLGILPRYAEDESEITWIDVPGLNMLHSVNAWEEEEGNVIVMVASNVSPGTLFSGRLDMANIYLEKIIINITAKTVERQPLSHKFLEFGVTNPKYAAKKNRYVYAVIANKFPGESGVVKLDLSLSGPDHKDCVVASHLYKSGSYGGEPIFVPREPNNSEAEEDDGYLLTYVHDENSKESKFLVMDAKSPSLNTIAVVKLPQRVPFGFHGIFVSDKDLH